MRRLLVEREIAAEGIIAPGQKGAAPAKQAGGRRRLRTVNVNLVESPITWLHARGHLGDRECAAGEQLRRDFEAAQLAPGISMRWDGAGVKGGANSGLHASERQIAAKARFDGALAAAGKGLGDVLWRVACAGEALVDAERALGWPARSGKLVLKLALERVADYYRLP